MSEVQRGITYLFVLAFALILFAYWAGANQLAGTGITGLNTLGLTFTGRNSSGQFASYPSGGPTS